MTYPVPSRKRDHEGEIIRTSTSPVPTSLNVNQTTADNGRAQREQSPAMSTTSSLTELTPSIGRSPAPGNVGIPQAKKRKLTAAEKAVEQAVRKREREEREQKKAEEKAQKEEEKRLKNEERRLKEEEKEATRRAKELEKAEKQKAKDAEKQEKEAEKTRKEAEKLKKERVCGCCPRRLLLANNSLGTDATRGFFCETRARFHTTFYARRHVKRCIKSTFIYYFHRHGETHA